VSRKTDYQFIDTDTEALQALLISGYEKITGITVRPASPERLFIQWVAAVVLQERVLLNYTGNQNIPSRAEGANLDALSELFYASARPEATAAQCTVRFSISEAQTSAVSVPAGTRLTDASGTLYWETIQSVLIAAGSTYVDTLVRCRTPGTIGNGYAIGQLNKIVDLYDYCSSVANLTESDGGTDEASDDEYYEILRQSMEAYSVAGSMGAYQYHAKSVSTAIADVAAIRPKESKDLTLDLYSLAGTKYAFVYGDLSVSSLKVYAHGGTTEATIDTDYTVSYSDDLLTITVIAGGSLESCTQVDVEVDAINGGCVEIYALMDDGTAAGSTIKSAMLTACSDKTVRPLTDHVSVGDPIPVPYNINLTYYLPKESDLSNSEIIANVNYAVAEYKKWQCGKLGRDINPSHLIGLLMQSGIKRCTVTSPVFTQLKDGSGNEAPQLAVCGTTTIVNGGQEDE